MRDLRLERSSCERRVSIGSSKGGQGRERTMSGVKSARLGAPMSRMLFGRWRQRGRMRQEQVNPLHLHLVLEQLDRMNDSLGTVCAVRVCERAVSANEGEHVQGRSDAQRRGRPRPTAFAPKATALMISPARRTPPSMLQSPVSSSLVPKGGSQDSLDLEPVLEQIALTKGVHDLDQDLDS